jgi:TolB protein
VQWDEGHALQLTSGVATGDGASGISWTPDDRIIYSSISSGNVNLWIISSDGANQRQLTNTSYNNFYPAVSPDGRFILCSSQKDTTSHIYKMDIDGGNPVKLSLAEDYEPSISPDGKWVYYAGWATGKELIYRLPLAGGDTTCLSNNPGGDPRPSPDGKLLLCRYFDVPSQKWGNAILKSDNAAVQRSFTLPFSASTVSCLWSPDGKSITYVDTKNGVSNIWGMPAGGGEPVQLTHFSSMLINSYGYGWSPDGKYLAVARSLSTSDVVLITEKK